MEESLLNIEKDEFLLSDNFLIFFEAGPPLISCLK